MTQKVTNINLALIFLCLHLFILLTTNLEKMFINVCACIEISKKGKSTSSLSKCKQDDQGDLVLKHRFKQILLHAQNKGGRPHMDIA